MKKANVNLFDKNKVQLKLLKNKNLRISDGRRNPTKVINLKKTGITIWTDGKHLKVFRGDLLKEIIGRSVYRTNKFETVEFTTTKAQAKRSIKGSGALQVIGASDILEGRSIKGSGTSQVIGASDILEGRSIKGSGTSQVIGASDILEGRSASDDILIIGTTNGMSEGRSIEEERAISITLNAKSVVVKHGKIS